MLRLFSSVSAYILFILFLSLPTKSFSKDDYHNVFYKACFTDTVPSINGTEFFVSNKGSDTNDGRSPTTPKLNISNIEKITLNTASATSGLTLNLEENSLFREQYTPLTNNLNVKSFNSKN